MGATRHVIGDSPCAVSCSSQYSVGAVVAETGSFTQVGSPLDERGREHDQHWKRAVQRFPRPSEVFQDKVFFARIERS